MITTTALVWVKRLLRIIGGIFIWGIPLIFAFLLYKMYANHHPIRSGNTAGWARYACGVELDALTIEDKFARDGGVYPVRGDLYLYYTQSHHYMTLYAVPESEMVADLPQLAALLNIPVTEIRHPNFWQEMLASKPPEKRESYEMEELENAIKERNMTRERCLSITGGSDIGTETLRKISDAASADTRASTIKYLDDRIMRAGRVWLTLAFELVFAVGWWVFTCWPYFRRGSKRGWGFHLGFSPLLAMLPFYLGYAPDAFSTSATSAYLYNVIALLAILPFMLLEFIVVPIQNFIAPVDIVILNFLPKPLHYFSQAAGGALASSTRGFIGPTILIATGYAVYKSSDIWRTLRARLKHGSPSENPPDATDKNA